MNRIDKLFNLKHNKILSVYFTAGYPTLNSTVDIIRSLADAGADMIELGMPFSDPMADGPVIQQSNDKALSNGMSLKILFNQLENIRELVDIPILLMGYLNPVYQFGFDDFCRKCHETGIDGIILPDLPPDVYNEKYRDLFARYNLHNVFLISPQTSTERIMQIDSLSGGFIYMVSSSSTTGEKGAFSEKQVSYFDRIKKMDLRSPRLIGFGISDSKGFSEACNYANGAIIGSAFVRMLGDSGDIDNGIKRFIADIRRSNVTVNEH